MSDNILIRRAPRGAQHPYMQLLRKTAQDSSLTLEERGLLIYILSLPHYMITDIVEMGKKNGIGRDKVRKIINSLKKHGYCYCQRVKDENGRYKATEYLFSEEKMEVQEKIPETENQALDSSSWNSVDGSQEKKDPAHIIPLDKKYKSKDITPPTPSCGKKAAKAADVCDKSKKSKKVFYQIGSHVQVTREEYTDLCEQYGKAPIDTLIEEMNDYCAASKPKGYADYAAALRQWMRKRLGQGVQPKKERKFAPCSDDNKAREYLEEGAKTAL